MSITKTELLSDLSQATGLDKRTIDAVLAALAGVIKHELATQGEINIPGIVKFKAKTTPARATRLGVNPFTKQEQVFHSKPAGIKIRTVPLKAIKDLYK